MSGILFTDTFDVVGIDIDPSTGEKDKKFDKVSRLDAKSENYDTEITLDYNSDIYPITEGEKIEILLTERLYEGAADPEETAGYDPTRPLGDRADQFEYIMSGRVFKFAEEKSRAVIYMSFGGMLMALKGEARILTSHTYKVDSEVYLFVRKVI